MERSNIKAMIAMLFVLPFWFGCSNEVDEPGMSPESVIEYDGEPIPVSISVIGTDGYNGGVHTRSGADKRVFTRPLNDKFDTGFDVVTTIEPISEIATRADGQALANVRYRLLAYQGATISSTNFAGQGDYETDDMGNGTAIGTQLYLPGGSYTFVCYTFMTNDEIPAFDGASTLISVAQGDDFRTCIQRNITVTDLGGGSFVLDNDFSLQCARVTMELSTTGFADNEVNACVATLNSINDNTVNWDFSIKDMLPDHGTSGSQNFIWPTLNDTLISSNPEIILPISKRDLSLTLNNLTIGGEVLDGATFNYKNVEFLPGGNYKVTISIERNYIPVGGYKWAKGNVYKEGNDFFIEPTQDGYHPGMTGGTYFEWNTLDLGIGTRNQAEYDYKTDPCSKITPVGTWQTPSRVAAVALAQNYQWDGDAAGMWFGVAPNRVFLPAVGARAYNGVSTPILDNDGTFALYSLQDNSPRYNQALSLEEGGVYVMSNLQRTYGLPIRCVKKQ